MDESYPGKSIGDLLEDQRRESEANSEVRKRLAQQQGRMAMDGGGASQGTNACRETARGMLERRAYECDEIARRLRILANALPSVLPVEADAILYAMLRDLGKLTAF